MRLFFFGDSICVGHLISLHKTWIVQVSSKLAEEGLDVVVQNSSVNGNTTRMALERMYYDVLDFCPDLLYIQFGLNDSNYWETDVGVPRVSKNGFETNLYEMIDRSFVSGVKKILLGTNHPILKDVPFTYAPFTSPAMSNKNYNSVIRSVASKRDIVLIDHEDLWFSSKLSFVDMLLPDGIHINERGHNFYFDSAFPIIEKTIKNI